MFGHRARTGSNRQAIASPLKRDQMRFSALGRVWGLEVRRFVWAPRVCVTEKCRAGLISDKADDIFDRGGRRSGGCHPWWIRQTVLFRPFVSY